MVLRSRFPGMSWVSASMSLRSRVEVQVSAIEARVAIRGFIPADSRPFIPAGMIYPSCFFSVKASHSGKMLYIYNGGFIPAASRPFGFPYFLFHL